MTVSIHECGFDRLISKLVEGQLNIIWFNDMSVCLLESHNGKKPRELHCILEERNEHLLYLMIRI